MLKSIYVHPYQHGKKLVASCVVK